MSSTCRPRRPPFLLTSSFQIWMARSAGLPLAESPPVSAMPKPILIGSAARAVKVPALASTSVTTTAPTRAQVIDRLQDCFMPSLPLCSPRAGGGPQTAPGAVGLSRPPRPHARRGALYDRRASDPDRTERDEQSEARIPCILRRVSFQMVARSYHGYLRHVQDLARAVTGVRARQARPPAEDLPAVARHPVVDEQAFHPDLVADANRSYPLGDCRVGRDEMIVRDLFGVEGRGEAPGPAEGAGEFPARILHLLIRPVADRLAPDDTDVLDIAGIGLVVEIEQRVAAVLRDHQS